MRTSKREKISVDAIIYAFILFLQVPAQYVWVYQSSFSYSLLIAISSVACTAPHFQVKGKISYLSFALFFLLLIFYVTGPVTLIGVLRTMMIYTLLFVDRIFFRKVFHAFTLLFSIMLIPSIIEFILVELCGINIPNKSINSPYESEKFLVYAAYPFHIKEIGGIINLLPRFSSYFDEPGVVGTISGVLLCCQHVNLKRKYNIPILLAGILSFSLFFYLLLVLYFIFFFKSAKIRIILLGMMAGIGLYLYSIDNEIINTYIFDRLVYDEDKGFSGNNRTAAGFDEWFAKYSKTSDAWLGLGRGTKNLYDEGGASYKDRIVEYGYVGFGLYLVLMLSYIFVSYRKNKKNILLALILFLTCVWQRPFIDVHFYMVLFMFILCCIENKSKQKLGRKKHRIHRSHKKKMSMSTSLDMIIENGVCG